MIRGWKKLNAKDKKHLENTKMNATRVSTVGFLRNLKGQRESGILCFECEDIARKTGLDKI